MNASKTINPQNIEDLKSLYISLNNATKVCTTLQAMVEQHVTLSTGETALNPCPELFQKSVQLCKSSQSLLVDIVIASPEAQCANKESGYVKRLQGFLNSGIPENPEQLFRKMRGCIPDSNVADLFFVENVKTSLANHMCDIFPYFYQYLAIAREKVANILCAHGVNPVSLCDTSAIAEQTDDQIIGDP